MRYTAMRLVMAFGLMISFGSGCSRSGLEKDTSTQEVVEVELSPQDQFKRQVLERSLRAFLNGVVDASDLQLEAGRVDFQEQIHAFYGGKARLVRYEFSGPPRGDEQEVKLTFDDQPFGELDSSSASTENRVYRIVDNGSGNSITRVR
jgi:hypothetical protein